MKLYLRAIILTVILAILVGGYLYIMSISKKQEVDNYSKDDTIRVTQFDSEKLTEVVIKNRDGQPLIIMEKKDKEWTASYPQGFRADKQKLESLALNLSGLAADKVIEEDAQDTSVYGFNTPIEVTAKLSDGTTKIIQIGDKTPTKAFYYVREKGSNKVYTIDTYQGDLLIGDKKNLWDVSVFSVEKESVIGLALTKGSNKIFASKKIEDGTWNLTYPIEGTVGLDKIMPIIDDIANIFFVDIEEEKVSDLEKYGLKNPSYKIEVETAEGKTEILFGKEKARNSQVYLKLHNRDVVYVVDVSRSFSFLDKPLKEIMDTFAYIVNIKDVNKIVVEMDGKTTTCELQTDKENKEYDKFTVDGRNATITDSNGRQPFRAYYQALIGITLSEIEPDSKPLGKADITFTYYLKKDPGTMKVEFVPKDSKYYYVLRNGKYSGIIVEKSEFDEKDGVRDSYNKLMDALAGIK